MSTVVLARKYRPKRFDQMVGQEHVVRALSNALEQNRLHHAYLFTGTRGIGKTTVSRILAKSLNCTGADGSGGITAHPCGVCSACTEIDADRYIDYIELDAASNRSIDEIRDLIERAAYKPGIGRFKVFMIDEAHQLTKDAFNALLKTLEEPPDYLKFVLATTDPDKMLPTVLSRCLQFNLRPMPPEVVREHLAQVLQAEGLSFEPGALRLLGRAARGSMRDALSLTDQAIAYGGGRLDEAVLRSMLGTVDRSHAVTLVQALAAREGREVLQAVDALRARGLSASGTLEEMTTLLQQMAVAQAVPDALDAADPDQVDAQRLAPSLAPDETQLLYSMLLHGRAELALMSDEYAALTMVLLRFLAFPPAAAGAAAVPAPPSARASAPAADTSAPAPAPARPAPPAGRPPAPAAVAPQLRQADTDIPPWVDEGPPLDDEPGPRAAPLRAPAPPALVVPASQPAAPDAQAPDEADAGVPEPNPLVDRWAAVVRPLAAQGRITALVRELAWQADVRTCVDDDGAEESAGCSWTLVVDRASLRSDALRDKLATVLTTELGRPQRLLLEAGAAADSVSRREAWERQRRQAEAERLIRDDPAVQSLLAQFKTARIVPGSIKPH
jgi:DNA polymerase-3 subunit gamma/tau